MFDIKWYAKQVNVSDKKQNVSNEFEMIKYQFAKTF